VTKRSGTNLVPFFFGSLGSGKSRIVPQSRNRINGTKERGCFRDGVTKDVWYYDYRTNIHHTLKRKPLRLEDLRDFIDSLADLDNLPEPEILAEEIIDNIEAGLTSFRAVVETLANSRK